MPFAWYYADVPESYRVSPDKARAMYEREIAERASLLLRLGYAAQQTKQRLRAEVAWDFELHRSPEHVDRIDEIVDRVFRRRGVGAGAPTL